MLMRYDTSSFSAFEYDTVALYIFLCMDPSAMGKQTRLPTVSELLVSGRRGISWVAPLQGTAALHHGCCCRVPPRRLPCCRTGSISSPGLIGSQSRFWDGWGRGTQRPPLCCSGPPAAGLQPTGDAQGRFPPEPRAGQRGAVLRARWQVTQGRQWPPSGSAERCHHTPGHTLRLSPCGRAGTRVTGQPRCQPARAGLGGAQDSSDVPGQTGATASFCHRSHSPGRKQTASAYGIIWYTAACRTCLA